MEFDKFLTPAEYFKMFDILKEVKLTFLVTKLPEEYMSTREGTILLKDLLDLVCENIKRGHCIARSLTEDNLEVSLTFGTFRIINPLADPIDEVEDRYKGYRVAKKLWIRLLVQRYREEVLDKLPPDQIHLFGLIDEPKVREDVITHHASLLGPYGRIGLALRFDMMLRMEMTVTLSKVNMRDAIVKELPYTKFDDNGIIETDHMHDLFRYHRETSIRLSTNMGGAIDPARPPIPDPSRPEILTEVSAGLWVVALHRIGLHRGISNGAFAVVMRCYYAANPTVERRKVIPYDVFKMSSFHHLKMPLFFPRVQVLLDDNKLTQTLGMNNFFPEKKVFSLPQRGGK